MVSAYGGFTHGGDESLMEEVQNNSKLLKVIRSEDQNSKNLIDTNNQRDSGSEKAISENRIGRQRAHGFDPFLSPREAADYLGVSVRFIYERVATGELESQPMGRLRRIRLSTLENWLVRQQNGATP